MSCENSQRQTETMEKVDRYKESEEVVEEKVGQVIEIALRFELKKTSIKGMKMTRREREDKMHLKKNYSKIFRYGCHCLFRLRQPSKEGSEFIWQ